jgi:hypothetical protein
MPQAYALTIELPQSPATAGPRRAACDVAAVALQRVLARLANGTIRERAGTA